MLRVTCASSSAKQTISRLSRTKRSNVRIRSYKSPSTSYGSHVHGPQCASTSKKRIGTSCINHRIAFESSPISFESRRLFSLRIFSKESIDPVIKDSNSNDITKGNGEKSSISEYNSLPTLLHNRYKQIAKRWPKHKNYSFEKVLLKDGNLTTWRASFLCPITGIRIHSGTLRDENFYVGDRISDVFSDGGKLSYRTPSVAKRVCAATVADCLFPDARRYCEEDPSVDLHTAIIKAMNGNEIGTLHSIPQFVHNRYEEIAKRGPKHENYSFEKVLLKDGNLITWKASFLCPITGIRIHSGTLRNEKSFLGDRISDVLSDGGEISYRSQYVAKRVCAATVADYLAANDIKHAIPGTYQYCEEDPNVDLHAAIRESNMGTNADTNKDAFTEAPASASLCTLVQQQQNVSDVSEEKSYVFPTKGAVKRFENPMSALFHLHRLYNPKDLKAAAVNDGLTYKSISHRGIDGSERIYWTSEFRSPVTSEIFSAGNSIGQDSICVDGKAYYGGKKAAKAAVLSRAVDCFVHRQGWINHDSASEPYQFPSDYLEGVSYEPFCLDTPYDSSADVKICLDPIRESNMGTNADTNKDAFTEAPASASLCTLVQQQQNVSDVSEEKSYVFPTKGAVKRFENPMSALFHLHRLYNPKDLKAAAVNDGLTYKSISHRGIDGSERIYWTSEFRSPVTSEIFSAGNSIGQDSICVDGKAYYGGKKAAKAAVLSRAVDCFVHRQGWINHDSASEPYQFPSDYLEGVSYEPFCLDTPYDSSADVKICLDPFVPPPRKENTSETLVTAKSVVYNSYQKVLREAINQDCFVTESIDVDINGEIVPYWTSTFECPITGRLFGTGTLIYADEDPYDESSFPTMQVVGGVICYSNQKLAEHACAGRTFDILSASNFFSSFGANNHYEVPQFCQEDPNSDEEECEEVDEFVIETIPFAGNFGLDGSTCRTTMDVILDTWAEHSSNRANDLLSGDPISTAVSWIENMQAEADGLLSRNTPTALSSLRQSTVSTFSCNAILKALANCKKPGADDDIRQLSRKILSLMIDLSRDRSEVTALSCSPDVTTFNLFIPCIRSTALRKSAEEAEAFLEDMLNGRPYKGFGLPKPDSNTFNTVMKQWQSVPDEEKQDHISRLFLMLEAKMTPLNTLGPNKETFMIALRSLASERRDETSPFIFNPEKAQKWIDCMEKHALQSNEENMTIDADVYNAALPCESYKTDVQKQTFPSRLSAGNIIRHNACNVEKWFRSMQRISSEEGKQFVAPNRSTYESVIQAWVQNKSKEGLANAEKWAFEAVDDPNIYPRIDMFRTLIEAWAHSGDESSPMKIQTLIERLDALSKTIPELEPDGNLRSLTITAWRNYQLRYGDKSSTVGHPSDLQGIGPECMAYLTSIVDKNEDNILQGGVFELLIDIWSDTSSLQRTSRDDAFNRAGGMIDTIDIYYKYIDSYNLKNPSSDNGISESDKRTTQLFDTRYEKHLSIISDGDSIFEKLIKSMLSVAGPDEALSKEIADEYFHKIESYLSRRDKFQRGLSSSELELDAGQRLPLFPEALFQETMNFSKYLISPTRNGDAVKVAMDIFHCTLRQLKQDAISQTQAIAMYSLVIDVFDTVVSNQTEKSLLMNRILKNILESNPKNETIVSAIKRKIPDEVDLKETLQQATSSPSMRTKKRKRTKRKKRV